MRLRPSARMGNSCFLFGFACRRWSVQSINEVVAIWGTWATVEAWPEKRKKEIYRQSKEKKAWESLHGGLYTEYFVSFYGSNGQRSRYMFDFFNLNQLSCNVCTCTCLQSGLPMVYNTWAFLPSFLSFFLSLSLSYFLFFIFFFLTYFLFFDICIFLP